MKRLFSCWTILLLIAACVPALGEGQPSPGLTGTLEDGCYILRVAVSPDDPGEWKADKILPDGAAVSLDTTEQTEDGLVLRYVPLRDGTATILLRHFTGIACDELHGIELKVTDGRIEESPGGFYTASPDENDLDTVLSGRWLEEGTQFTSMTVIKNPEGGWDVELVSPVSHGAWVFRAAVFYDCEQDALVYEGGRFYDLPAAGPEAVDPEKPAASDITGAFFLTTDDGVMPALTWTNSRTPDETVRFVPAS